VELTARVWDVDSGTLIDAFEVSGEEALESTPDAVERLRDAWNGAVASRILGRPVGELAARIGQATSGITAEGLTAPATTTVAADRPAPPPPPMPASPERPELSEVAEAPEGKVVGEQNGQVYVGLGLTDGIQVGDRLDVRRAGPPLRDPDTGEVLGMEEHPVGTLEVERVQGDRLSLARVRDGDNPRVGDTVVPRRSPERLDGKVARVEGETIYLGLGAGDGLRVGDRLAVLREGEAVRDPDTGAILGTDAVRVGTVEVGRVLGEHLSRARSVEGAPPRAGDRVALR